ncbi:hypothetical protein D3C83_42800 [compost metagenome]
MVHATSYLTSPWNCRSSAFIVSLSGPIDVPSPITSSVTPWRMSLCERPSSISDSFDQHIILIKPGAMASPAASITVGAEALLRSPIAAIVSP